MTIEPVQDISCPEEGAQRKDDWLVLHCEKLASSPCMAAVSEAWVELMRAGFVGPHHTPFWGGWPICWNAVGGRVRGFIHYSSDDHAPEAFIRLGWVAPEFRRQGLYSLMYKDLRAFLKRKGFQCLQGSVYTENHRMQALARKLGRQAKGTYYEDWL